MKVPSLRSVNVAKPAKAVKGLTAWVAVLAASVSLLFVATFDDSGPATDGERIQHLQDSYACPVCQGESVAESNAAVAATIRKFIADEVAGGADDTEIRDELVVAYGAEVLLTPPADGLGTLLWVLPVVVVVAGSAGLASFVVGRSSTASREATDEDRALVAKAQEDLS